jgi:hypothetical protein
MPAKKTTKPAAKMTKSAKTKLAKAKTAKTAAPAKATKTKKADGKMSALDAAAKVLAEAGEPMNTKAMIKAMVRLMRPGIDPRGPAIPAFALTTANGVQSAN